MALRGAGGIGQFAKEVDEFHVLQGTGSGAGDSGVRNDYRKALRPGDGHIHTVAVKDKGQSA